MKSFITKRISISVGAVGFLAISALLTIALVSQHSVFAAYTFPDVYDLVTINNTDAKGINGNATVNGMSADGSRILFVTSATNLPQATSGVGVYLRDMDLSSTLRVDTSAAGIAPNKASVAAVMNSTGRYVAFSSTASNLIDGVVMDSSILRIYLKDLQTNTTELITDINGPSITYDTYLRPFAVSDDGRFVYVSTNNVNILVPGTRAIVDGSSDRLTYDRVNERWIVLSRSASGVPQNWNITSTSCDGSLMVFSSTATDLVDNYSGSGKHVYLVDLRNGVYVSDVTAGSVGDSSGAYISCNGRYIVYSTTDRTLIPVTPGNMNSTSSQAVRYDRFTGGRIYVGGDSNNFAYSSRYSSSEGIDDRGNVLLVRREGPLDMYDSKLYLKHLSDGSGSLESVTHNYAGMNAYMNSYKISADGKYIVTSISAPAGGVLGLNIYSNPDVRNIMRVHTGL